MERQNTFSKNWLQAYCKLSQQQGIVGKAQQGRHKMDRQYLKSQLLSSSLFFCFFF